MRRKIFFVGGEKYFLLVEKNIFCWWRKENKKKMQGVKSTNQQSSLLQTAALRNDIQGARRVLEKGVSESSKNKALYIAAGRGHNEIVQILLDSGADVNADNARALQKAASIGLVETVMLLLSNGADMSLMPGKYRTMVVKLIQPPIKQHLPEGTEDPIQLEPITGEYYQCENPGVKHYFSKVSLERWCSSKSTPIYEGGCKCPIDKTYEISPQIYTVPKAAPFAFTRGHHICRDCGGYY